MSPHSDIYQVRKEVTNLGYKIVDELFIYDQKKPYVIIKFVKGKEKYSDDELFFGPIILKEKNDSFYRYYHEIIKKNKEVLEKVPNDNIIKKSIEKEIKKIESVLN